MGVKLSIKQQAFADLYIELGNATEAYLKAYTNVKKETTARANGSRLLTNANVSQYIGERMEELKSERVPDQQEVMEFLTSVMRGEIQEPLAVLASDGSQDVVLVRPNAQARKAAAELIVKRYTIWTDKQQLDVQGAVTFIDDIGDEDEA